MSGNAAPNRWIDLSAGAPWELPRHSERIVRARGYIFESLQEIKDDRLRFSVTDMLKAATSPDRILIARSKLLDCDERTARKFRERLPYDPTWAAPGARRPSHHSYPGGWALHTALNLRAAKSLVKDASSGKNAKLDADTIIAAMILHDWAKLRLLVWGPDHSLDGDEGPGHHELALAECMARGFSPRLVQLMAGIHGGWWTNPGAVRKSLADAAHLVSDLVDTGTYLQDLGMETSLESWIVHQGERSWYAPSRSLLAAVDDKLRRIFAPDGGAQESFARLRNTVYMIFDEFELAELLSREATGEVKGVLEGALSATLPAVGAFALFREEGMDAE